MTPSFTKCVSANYLRLFALNCLIAWGLIFVVHADCFAASATRASADRPNILWITSEDNSISWVSCYGSPNVKTPAIDQLAIEGFRYRYCFDNAAVCAPTRSTWITGMHAISNGTQPMRSRNVIPHDLIKYYPDLLRKVGYHTSNPGKTDYNIGGREDKDCWDYKKVEENEHFGWRKRKPGQPFFCVYNIFDSHESRSHGEIDEHGSLQTRELKDLRSDPAKMVLHSYHPDLQTIRKNYALYADYVENMDRRVQDCINSLKYDGLYEDTIIIYNSDHGGVLARSKRFLYSSGVHCPLIIRIPEKWKHLWPANKPGAVVDRLVSFVDMPKTWLSLAGVDIPDTFQGCIFLGKETENEPKHHFAYRERADERCDSVRMVRDKRYAYHKNYMPFAPGGQYLQYMWRAPATHAWEQHHREGKTDEVTGRFFRTRVSEEFYDNETDFDNVNNLIHAPEHQQRIAKLKRVMRARQLELYDSGLLPETIRERRAAANGLTIYEMVRDKELYPLSTYLDAADRALERDANNLVLFVKDLSDEDDGLRYWAIVGLHLLYEQAAPATESVSSAMDDDSDEVRTMAAWTLVNLGQKEEGLSCLRKLLLEGSQCSRFVHNTIDWMGEVAFPLIKEHKATSASEAADYHVSILGRSAALNGL